MEVVAQSEKSSTPPNTWFICSGITLFKSDELYILEASGLQTASFLLIKGLKKEQFLLLGGRGGWGCKTALKVQHMAFIQKKLNLFKLLISIVATGLLFLHLELVLDAFSGWTACIHLHQMKASS